VARHRLDDLARLGVATQRPLGEHQLPLDAHLEGAAGGLDQLDVGRRPRLLELGRQTGGPWLVASNDAVFDRDVHGGAVRIGDGEDSVGATRVR